MCDENEIPMIELHDLTGEAIGIRRDVIALVKAHDAEQNPLGGSMILTDTYGVHVLETPGEVLAAIKGQIVAVVDLGSEVEV
jgi:hypothetical protein